MADHLIVHSRKFLDLTLPIADLAKIADGFLWAEGPAYVPQGDYLIWSDIPNNRVYQWAEGMGTRVFDVASNNSNGHTVDTQGRVLSCEHLTRRVTRREHDGRTVVIADQHRGRRLNSPNDLVVKSDGTIWFTDPPYGILTDYEGARAPQEQQGCYVFRVAPDGGEPQVMIDDFVKPNGLAFSADEERLYVADSGLSHDPDGPHHIRVFDVDGDGGLRGGAVFAEIDAGVPDGLRVDSQGHVWTSTADGVSCYAPDGALLGEIRVPEKTANLCFGGPKRNRMFITASTSVYAIYLGVTG